MPRKWTKIEEVIDDYATGNNLAVVVDETAEHDTITIFSNTQVYSMLADLYPDFSFRHKESENASSAFIRQYTNYVASVEDAYFRMNDALTRLYNPINNYEMHESGADGHKIGKQTATNVDGGISGTAKGSETTTLTPSETTSTTTYKGSEKVEDDGTVTNTGVSNAYGGLSKGTENTAIAPATTTDTVTDAGSESVAHYVNGFDDSTANGTPAGRDVTTFTGRTHTSAVTTSGDGKNNITYGNASANGTATDYLNSTSKTLNATGQHEITQGFDSSESVQDIDTSHTKTFTNRSDEVAVTVDEAGENETTYGNVEGTFGYRDYVENEDVSVTDPDFHEVQQDAHSGKSVTETTHDKSLSYKDTDWTGRTSSTSIGSDFADGTMHEFTRSGNIGVTTSAQMIQGELDVRKVVLLEQFVSGFVKRYCSYLGDDD